MTCSIEVELQYVLQFDITCSKNYVIKTVILYGKFLVKTRVTILVKLMTGNIFDV